MTDRDEDVLGCYWTVSGPVEVHVGREWSLFDFGDRCAAAAKVGFRGIGLWHADLEHVLETYSLDEMARIMAGHGLDLHELEFLMEWFLDPSDERRVESDRTRRLLWEAAAALPAHHVKVGNIPGTPCDIDRLTERFAELCEDAARHHDVPVVYEFMPFDVNVRDLDTALALVEGAGAANSGLAIDVWHMSKLGIPPSDMGRIPLRYLSWVELNDGRLQDMPDLIDETVNHRLLPGEGEFDVRGYVDACRRAGYAGPWGVEVLSAELRELPMEEIFSRAYVTTSAQLSAPVHEESRS
jgi:sugar phosphate isomerase/epimerase